MQIVTYTEHLFVKRHRGTLPVILTAPHGGSGDPPGVQVREEDRTPPGCDFVLRRDNQTAPIAEAVAQRLLDLTGLSPYTVIALFRRRYADANRSAACAFTDPAAQPLYEEYHRRVARYVAEILGENQGRGFLFDIHGTEEIEADPADVYWARRAATRCRPASTAATCSCNMGCTACSRRCAVQPVQGEKARFSATASPRPMRRQQKPPP